MLAWFSFKSILLSETGTDTASVSASSRGSILLSGTGTGTVSASGRSSLNLSRALPLNFSLDFG